MRKSAKMVLLVSGNTSFEATKRTILPEEEKLIEPEIEKIVPDNPSISLPEKIRLNRGPNAGTWEAAWVHPTTNISDFDTGALSEINC